MSRNYCGNCCDNCEWVEDEDYEGNWESYDEELSCVMYSCLSPEFRCNDVHRQNMQSVTFRKKAKRCFKLAGTL